MQENVALGPITTFKIGGPALFFVAVRTIDELRQALAFAKEKKLRTLILGGGSNVLIDDAGFSGVVIQIAFIGIEEKEGQISVGAGVSWDELVAFSIEKNLWGLENLSGIPGSVGGAIVGGIGAYGAAVGEALTSVEVFDTESESVVEMSAPLCRFGYRDSIFKHSNRFIVLRAHFQLSHIPQPNLSYKDVGERLQERQVTLLGIRETILSIRSQKFPDLREEGTAGSFFKNPILNANEAASLQRKFPAMPTFSLPEAEGVKIPLAWLIDHVLHLKGSSIGGARLFERQPLVITSRGASSHDVRALAALVRASVKENFNIEIEEEVNVVSN